MVSCELPTLQNLVAVGQMSQQKRRLFLQNQECQNQKVLAGFLVNQVVGEQVTKPMMMVKVAHGHGLVFWQHLYYCRLYFHLNYLVYGVVGL